MYSVTFPTHFTHVKDDFLMNPLIQGKSGTTPVLSRNAFSTKQGTNEDDSQSDPHPEAGIFGNQTMRNSGQKDRRDMVTWGSEEIRNGQKYRRDTYRINKCEASSSEEAKCSWLPIFSQVLAAQFRKQSFSCFIKQTRNKKAQIKTTRLKLSDSIPFFGGLSIVFGATYLPKKNWNSIQFQISHSCHPYPFYCK